MLSAVHYCICASMCASFNFQHHVFTVWQQPFTNITAGLIKLIARQYIPQAYRDLLIFLKHFLLDFTSLTFFHSSNPNTKTELRCTIPWAVVNIICILSISSYPQQLSVRGHAGVHGMLQHVVWSTRILYHQHTLKMQIMLCEQKVKDLQYVCLSTMKGPHGGE